MEKEEFLMYNCAKCFQRGCTKQDMTKTLPECPSKDAQIQEEAKALYKEPENYKIAYCAALTEAGATILSVPAAFTRPTGAAHWHVLLRARAIEAGVHLVAAAQTGEHQDGRATYGHSLIVGPWGEVLLDMGEAAGLGFAEIDPAQVESVRERLPAIRHRRAIPPVVQA